MSLRKETLPPSDFISEKFLVSRYSPLPGRNRSQLAGYLGYEPQFSLYNGTFEQGIEHVRAGKGIMAAGKAYILSRNLDSLSAVPFPNPDYVINHYVAYKKDKEISVPIQQFIKTLKGNFRKSHPQHDAMAN